jgi:hypothetical protein
MGPLPGVIHFAPNATPYHIATVPEYRDVLTWQMGVDKPVADPHNVYSPKAWTTGRNRK